MTGFERGVQLYLLLLAFVATLAVVWGTNVVLLDNTTDATRWPLMIGSTGVFVALGVPLHRSRTTDDRDPAPSPWSGNRRG